MKYHNYLTLSLLLAFTLLCVQLCTYKRSDLSHDLQKPDQSTLQERKYLIQPHMDSVMAKDILSMEIHGDSARIKFMYYSQKVGTQLVYTAKTTKSLVDTIVKYSNE